MERQKIMVTLSFMKGGSAACWANSYLMQLTRREEEVPPQQTGWDNFMDNLEMVIGDSDPGAMARHKIYSMKQASHTANVYIMNFEEYEFKTGYNDTALIEIFKDSMNMPLLKKIYALPMMPANLKEWKQWDQKLD
jgi:hypothetical protein